MLNTFFKCKIIKSFSETPIFDKIFRHRVESSIYLHTIYFMYERQCHLWFFKTWKM